MFANFIVQKGLWKLCRLAKGNIVLVSSLFNQPYGSKLWLLLELIYIHVLLEKTVGVIF